MLSVPMQVARSCAVGATRQTFGPKYNIHTKFHGDLICDFKINASGLQY